MCLIHTITSDLFLSLFGKVYRTDNYCLGNVVEAVRVDVQIESDEKKQRRTDIITAAPEELRKIM